MKCSYCEDAEAALQCYDCKAPLCAVCSEQLHSKPFYKEHAVGKYEPKILADVYCERHPRYVRDIVHVETGEVVCLYCLEFSVDRGERHLYKPASAVIGDLRKEIASLFAALSTDSSALEGTEQALRARLESIRAADVKQTAIAASEERYMRLLSLLQPTTTIDTAAQQTLEDFLHADKVTHQMIDAVTRTMQSLVGTGRMAELYNISLDASVELE